jgi:5'-deoxynucleotidase YfbR-like HD superfamily hydrolase
MKFPITRKCLQAFDSVKEQAEIKEEEIQKGLTKIVEQLCGEFKKSIQSNSKEKKFVWELTKIRKYYTPGFYLYSDSTVDELLPQIINKLKELFIGCDIIIDPLKTYLIIDWS